jgi:hypothetical protein
VRVLLAAVVVHAAAAMALALVEAVERVVLAVELELAVRGSRSAWRASARRCARFASNSLATTRTGTHAWQWSQ